MQFWSFLSWADGASIERDVSWVDEASAQKARDAYAEVKKTGQRGTGFRQGREALKAAADPSRRSQHPAEPSDR